MARHSGRNGRIYLELTTPGSAAAFPFVASWTLTGTTDKIEVTAMGDTNKTYVSGLPDAAGTFEGFLDDTSAPLYAVAQDGIARKFYLYPNLSVATSYWFGTVLPDFSAGGGVSGGSTLSSSWAAASPILRVA